LVTVDNIRNGSVPVPYALKVQKKLDLIKMKHVQSVMREMKMLRYLKHPFINRLIASFCSEFCVYMLIDLVQGGELYSLMRKSPTGMQERNVMFYAGTVLLALTYMHERNVVYRDLKPENILINADGYPVIIDFGFGEVPFVNIKACCFYLSAVANIYAFIFSCSQTYYFSTFIR